MKKISDSKASLKTKATNKFHKISAATTAGLMTLSTACPVYAAGPSADPTDNIIGEVGGIVCRIFLYVGIVLLIYSIAQLISASRNDDPEGKVKATQQLVAAIVMMGLKPIINGVLAVTGTNITIP